MSYASSLIPGTLLARRMRFLADIRLDDGTQITAHVPNSGAMTGVKAPGMRVWVSHSPNPNRKLAHTLELVEADHTLVGVNTSHPNRLVEQAIAAGTITELSGYAQMRREVKYGTNSRIDLLLSDPGRADCYVEVKNVHMMRQPGVAEFPDSVTARGAKHMHDLAQMVRAGHRAVVLFVVQRMDAERFRIADDCDPAYFAALTDAVKTGVEVLCYGCMVSTAALSIDRAHPWSQT